LLHTYSLFQIPAFIVTVTVGALIAYGIYHFMRKTDQPALPNSPALPGPPAPTVGTINVQGYVGSVSLSI